MNIISSVVYKVCGKGMCIAFSRIMLLPQICCSGISLFIFQGTEILHYYSMISATATGSSIIPMRAMHIRKSSLCTNENVKKTCCKVKKTERFIIFSLLLKDSLIPVLQNPTL